MRIRTSVALVLAILLTSAVVWAQAPVKDDAYVTSTSTSGNYGGNASLFVQTGGASGGVFSYLRFDLSRIPTGAALGSGAVTSAMVRKATVRLYLTAVTGVGNFDVYEVLGSSTSQNWTESSITYNSQSSYSLKSIATGVNLIQATSQKLHYIDVDITQAVKDWLDYLNGAGGQYNNGIVIKPSTSPLSSISVAFSSKEDSTYSHDPELNIVFWPSQSALGVCASGYVLNGYNPDGSLSCIAVPTGAGGFYPAPTPTYSPAPGTYTTPQTVTFTCSSGTVACGLITGGQPLASCSNISVASTTSFYVGCYAPGLNTTASSVTYTINSTGGGGSGGTGYTQLVSDNFNRANGPLGSNYTGCGYNGGNYSQLEVQNNEAGGSGYWSQDCSLYTGYGTFPNDQYATATIVGTPSNSTESSLELRGTATPLSNEKYIACGWDAQDFSPDYHYRIWSLTPGAPAEVSLWLSTVTPATNDVIWCGVSGSSVTLKVNGTILQTVTDTSGVSSGYPGMYYIDPNGTGPGPSDVMFDDFAAGSIP
jgi:hypothetical protein